MDSIFYSSSVVSIGRFRCPAEHPDFRDSGPIHDHLFVVPRSSVRIIHAGRSGVVADRNTVMFYNRAQVYRREAVSPKGDLCDWFRVREDVLTSALERFDPSVAERPGSPFSFRRGPMGTGVFSDGLRIVNAVRSVAPMAVDEAVLGLLDRVIEAVYRSRARPAERSRGSERELAEEARRLLAARYADGLTIDEIAREVASSPFHLARAFKRQTGTTLHTYRTQLRLRAALVRLADGVDDLSALAHDLGFSSHSHFTETFRRRLGRTPSAMRADLSAVGPPRRRSSWAH